MKGKLIWKMLIKFKLTNRIMLYSWISIIDLSKYSGGFSWTPCFRLNLYNVICNFVIVIECHSNFVYCDDWHQWQQPTVPQQSAVYVQCSRKPSQWSGCWNSNCKFYIICVFFLTWLTNHVAVILAWYSSDVYSWQKGFIFRAEENHDKD
jgi:hypothetical protein